MTDHVIVAVLLLSFATFVTTHVAIAVRLLMRREDRWRGVVIWVAPPLGLVWAVRRGWYRSAALWGGSAVLYVVALFVGLR